MITKLTELELLNFQLIGEGLTVPQVARQRGVGVQTVKTQLRMGREKLGAKTTAHGVWILAKRDEI